MTPLSKSIVKASLMCFIGASALANNRVVQRSLDEIQLAQDQVSVVMQQSAERDTRERLRYAHDRLNSAEQLLERLLSQGDGRPHPYPPSRSIELYRSDSCSSELVGTLRQDMNCSAIANSRVWGMKIDGKCFDIHDMSGAEVCQAFVAAHNPNALELYKSDSCSSELVGMVDARTDCRSLPSKRVWGIKRNGVCHDITDMDLPQACERFR